MPWWIELPPYLLASLALSYSIASVMLLPGVMYFFKRHLLGPLSALFIVTGPWVVLSDPNPQTLSGLASFLHSDSNN